jgi:hypothetical protein
VIESIAGVRVLGYRCPGFSCTAATPWFFDMVEEGGYRYDSSVFPGSHGHGGVPAAPIGPHRVDGHALVEMPITVARRAGAACAFSAADISVSSPYAIIRAMTKHVLNENRPVVFYVHPRAIDPGHPRMAMSASRRFKSYVNLQTTAPKMRSILRGFSVAPFARTLFARAGAPRAPASPTAAPSSWRTLHPADRAAVRLHDRHGVQGLRREPRMPARPGG